MNYYGVKSTDNCIATVQKGSLSTAEVYFLTTEVYPGVNRTVPGVNRPLLFDASILCVAVVKWHVTMSFFVNEIVNYLIELTVFFIVSLQSTVDYKEHYLQDRLIILVILNKW